MILHGFFASFRDICLFRRGPEDVPYAPRLLVALVVACVAVQTFFDLHYGAKPVIAIAVLAGWVGVLGVLVALLRGRGKPERFVQTATAFTAVTLLANLVVYPLALMLPLKQILEHPDPADFSGGHAAVMLIIVAVGFWELCVWVGILRHSLEISLAGAVLVFLMLMFVNWLVAGVFTTTLGAAP